MFKNVMRLILTLSFISKSALSFIICEKPNERFLSDSFHTKSGRKPETCFGNYSVACGESFCAHDKLSCEIYLKVKSNLLRLLLSPSMYQVQLRKYEKELQSIKKCPESNYRWNKEHVCVKSSYCYLQVEFPHTMKKKIECPCDRQNGYQCMKNFCAVSKKACAIFKEMNQNSNYLDSIKKCRYYPKSVSIRRNFML